MSRPKHPNLATALALVQSGTMSAAEAAREFNIAKSSISRALSAIICPCCKRPIPKQQQEKPLGKLIYAENNKATG